MATFLEEELRHMHNSLRKKPGDTVAFIDGKGGLYSGIIQDISRKKAVVEILSHKNQIQQSPFLEIAIAPTKNMDRLEWFVEKSVELGIQKISFILCKHSERKNLKMDRINRIIVAACKQSKKAHFPEVSELQKFSKWLSEESVAKSDFIACLTEQTEAFSTIYKPETSARICIGPEGGFRDEEIREAEQQGFTPVHLGSQRLRTETAGLFSVASFRVLNQK